MEQGTCPYCGDSMLRLSLGSHMRICEKKYPEPKFSLRHLEKRVAKIEKILGKRSKCKCQKTKNTTS